MPFVSKPEYSMNRKEHKHEQWIFLNGVAVGYVHFCAYSSNLKTKNLK